MMIYPYMTHVHNEANFEQRYDSYERDAFYFRHTLEALLHWNNHFDVGTQQRPVIPEISDPNIASREVKRFFDNDYRREGPPSCERFNEAAELLHRIVQTNGVEGVYSFFRILSSKGSTQGNSQRDEATFKKIVSEVFVPHFGPRPTEEIVHGLTTLGHVLTLPLTGLASIAHAPVAAYSALRFKKLRRERLDRRESPPLEIVEHMLPLVKSMHIIAQQTVDILNVIEPIEGRTLPNVAPIDMQVLEKALERVRHGGDLGESHDSYIR
jgi:hypothetical protein